ncbi:tyrosine-type recombinase/integrase [Bacillus sp. E214]|uniref:tyrosine-type recombinase/integrase n=1 Tax=Bacillus sp. E214 TaxID=2587156 RepID=UPI00165284C5|nr:tyrosine-type recombinase/integrase [Bacillus sp. E214]
MARGSVKKLVSKTGKVSYCYTVDVGKKQDGRCDKRKRTFKKRSEAEGALNELLNDLKKGKFINNVKYTFTEFMDIWLKNIRYTVEDSTYEVYEQVVRLYLKQKLGSYYLSDLNIRLLTNFKTELHEKGLSNNYIIKIIAVLKNSLNYAVEQDYLAVNPAAKLKKPTEILITEIKWNDAHIENFLSYAKESVYYPAYLLAIFCGMRRGEVLGLRWSDIDMKRKKMVVVRVLSSDGKTFKDSLKTKGSRRSIDIPSNLLKELEMIKEKQLELKLESPDQDLVVPNLMGGPVHPRNLLRNLAMIVKESDVPKVTFHELRHLHASLLLQQNIHIKVVSERLGHTKISTTDRYSHLIPSLQTEAAESLNYLI